MNLVYIGKFIAKLRKEKGLTQEQLGEQLGVTNKTISRWETGLYLPPADALLAMSEMFGVSINEILNGNRLTEEEYKRAAEENLTQIIKEQEKESSFSLKDKVEFYKKKWLREHRLVLCICGLCIIGGFVSGIVLKQPLAVYGAILMFVVGHGWRNNTMMAYIENHAYDGTGK